MGDLFKIIIHLIELSKITPTRLVPSESIQWIFKIIKKQYKNICQPLIEKLVGMNIIFIGI